MRLKYIKICLLFLSTITFCSSNFPPESMSELLRHGMATGACSMILEETDPQFDLCSSEPYHYLYASDGFQEGIKHCRANFKCHRWNCSTHSDNNDYQLFGVGMTRASKESAVMLAMASAGMVEAITKGIQKGREKSDDNQHSVNSCYQTRRSTRNNNDYIVNCDADVTKSSEFAKKVVELWRQHQKLSSKEREMNIHNAAVGRLAIHEHMQQECRCIGLSGACNARYCYKTLSPLSVSTSWLKKRYDIAKKVRASRLRKRDGNGRLVTYENSTPPGKHDLIYLLDSPNYCLNERKTGSLGTTGRQCNACNSTSGLNSCEDMCCGRGYNTYVEQTEKNCKCKFQFCCDVKCKKCLEKRVIHRCK